jgi:hypothetical protein
MNPIKTILFHSIEPLINVCIKQAERHGLDEIRISLPRAREIHREIIIAKKALENHSSKNSAGKRQSQIDTYLDSVYNF